MCAALKYIRDYFFNETQKLKTKNMRMFTTAQPRIQSERLFRYKKILLKHNPLTTSGYFL